jgi:hypothetical protein
LCRYVSGTHVKVAMMYSNMHSATPLVEDYTTSIQL